MSSSPVRSTKSARTSTVTASKLFLSMAYDLKVDKNPEVLDCYTLLCNGKYSQFLSTLDAWTSQMYTSIGSLGYRLHQLAALFSKYPFDDSTIDRDAVAIDKFMKSERKCRRMNQKFRLRRTRVEPPHMQYMREFIIGVLGFEPNYPHIYDKCDFGPGSSVGVHGKDTSVLNKLDTLTITPSALPVATAALLHNLHYARYFTGSNGIMQLEELFAGSFKPVQVPYNKITCVPKSAKTSRTIAIEPTLNGFLQKGVDLVLRQKLHRIGIDLSKQSLNQALAKIGSRDGSYATIDLSAASDSISIQLVKELLPAPWFALLDSIRSPSYHLNGDVIRYEKFCSMGNGFCFPLETLIFRAAVEYAMNHTVVHSNRMVSVYGDDIIVPYECALLLVEVLHDLGFNINADKTFIVGPFRESCGADFFFGENVRPIYIKKSLTNDFNMYPLLNMLSERKFMSSWQTVFDSIPKRWQYLRPYKREGDGAITVNRDVFMTSRHAKWNRSLHTWTWKEVVIVPARGRSVSCDQELFLGKLRGDLVRSESFSARFSERTRTQLTS